MECPFYDDINMYGGKKVKANRWLSRKFLVMVATIVAEVLIGLGYNIDPELLIQLAVGIAGLYVIVEGLVDAVNKKPHN